MNIQKIGLKNFHCFEDREFSFGSRFNLIIGDNATGKTTLLDALSVGVGYLFLGFPEPASPRNITSDDVRLATYHHGDTWTPERQYPTEIECTGELGDQRGTWRHCMTRKKRRNTRHDLGIRSEALRLGDAVSQGKPAILPVVSYYGTGRLWVQIGQTSTEPREIDTLKPDTRFAGYLDCLNSGSDVKRLVAWFKTQELSALQQGATNSTLEGARQAILSCVPNSYHVGFDVSRGEMMIRFGERSLPFSYLSDGFRNMIAMVADIAVRCATLNPHLQDKASQETPGVVLIDEVDLHLHPRWQQKVVGDLLRAFPKVQFFGTTHSPFIIQSLPPIDGVRLMNLDDPEAEDFTNKSVEDITEEVQGVDLPQRSKRFKDMMHAAEQYFAILGGAADAAPGEREQMRRRLDELTTPYSDDPAYQAFLKMKRMASGIDGRNGDATG
jgi:predicted ATP-binding protein involved in virulence